MKKKNTTSLGRWLPKRSNIPVSDNSEETRSANIVTKDDILAETHISELIEKRYAYKNGDELYRKMFGDDVSITMPRVLNLTSSICRQSHFAYEEFRFWLKKLNHVPWFHRKQWEWFFILQALWERGKFNSGMRGLGFGVGREPLPALMAAYGCQVMATDQSLDGAIRAGWATSNQHSIDISGLNERGLCPPDRFRALVSFQTANMNNVPLELEGQFDFCWSACSLEHLGSLELGMGFIEKAMDTLRPGGFAVHTTEYNLSSNDATLETRDLSVYRRRDIEILIERLESKGFLVSPVDFRPSDGFIESIVDLPPFRQNIHLRLAIGDFVCTSIGLIVGKQ